MAEILESEQVGVAVNDFSLKSIHAGLISLFDLVETPGIQGRCVAAAQKHFSLDEGVRRYSQVYLSLDEQG